MTEVKTKKTETVTCIRCKGEGKIYFGGFGRAGSYRRGRGVKCKMCDGYGWVRFEVKK